MSIKVEVEGLKELTRKLNSPFAAKPARNFLNRGTLLIQRASRELAPIDRGRLVDSIDREIDTALLPLWNMNRLMYPGTAFILSMGMAMNVTEIEPPPTIRTPSIEKNIEK